MLRWPFPIYWSIKDSFETIPKVLEDLALAQTDLLSTELIDSLHVASEQLHLGDKTEDFCSLAN